MTNPKRDHFFGMDDLIGRRISLYAAVNGVAFDRFLAASQSAVEYP